MVEYICKSCNKKFIDKTKFTNHLNKKRPCIPKNNSESDNNSTINSNQIIKEEKLSTILDKFTNEKIVMPIIGKNKIDNHFSSICKLCKCTYKDTYINHLIEEHNVQKNEYTFTFSNKNSGTTIYSKEEDGGDIVLYLFEDNNVLLFTTKNLHNLQRHKKEKYRDVINLYYYPCKNIKTFKSDFILKCKDNGFKEDDKIDLIKCENIIYELLIKINENNLKENQDRKTIAPYKITTYFQCPFCEEKKNDKNELNTHLIETHKYLKNNNFINIDEEQKEKIFNMIENHTLKESEEVNQIIPIEEIKCDYCNNLFSSRFNLRRHLKMNCKKYQMLLQNNLLKDNEVLKDDLFNIIENNEKLRNENKILKNALVNNQELIKDQNDVLRNSVNYFSKTTNIIQNNNILFNINDFGQEDISHIDVGFIEDIITQMSTQSLVRFIEEVHYGNPKNCNVIIPTNIPAIQDKNLLLLKKGNKWVLDKRKNVIDDMLSINMDRISDVYEDIQPKLTNDVKTGFENYVSDMEDMNQKYIRNEAFEETEKLFIKKQPNNFLLETLKVQQNNFIEGNWKDTVDYQMPTKVSKIEDINSSQMQHFLNENEIINIDKMRI